MRACNGIVGSLFVLLLAAGTADAVVDRPDSLATVFEASAGRRTSRYAETIALCRRLDASSAQLVYTSFGRTPRGRELPLLIADREGRCDPAAVRADSGRVVVLVQACIHAGECCGKDAGLILLRDRALAGWPEGLLDRVTLLFIPIFNPDGHERFGPYNRINQNGPEAMGWRTTAANLNLNRDFLKADTAEMRAWLALWNAWLPDFLVDIHATDGADYQYDVTWQMEVQGGLDPGLADWSRGLLSDLAGDLAADGVRAGPYVWFRRWHDPTSGLVSWVASPRYSQGYAAQQNRPGLLVEAHMLKSYAHRVEAVRALLERLLVRLAAAGPTLRERVLAADRAVVTEAFRTEPFPLRFELGDEPEPFAFPGVEYEAVKSETTGGVYFRYHGDRPRTWVVDRYGEQVPAATARLPAAYLVPPEWDDVIDRLERHGVRVARLATATELEVRGYRFRDAVWRERPVEGRHPATFAVDTVRARRDFPAGTAVIDMRQRTARVIAHALEPLGPDSFAAWGFFDAVFDPVEYVEPYVIEAMIPELLAADPELRRRFAERRSTDPAFASDPSAVRAWFYRQTPYADARAGLYPVGLLDDAGQLSRLLGR
jgi:hypothetical protein